MGSDDEAFHWRANLTRRRLQKKWAHGIRSQADSTVVQWERGLLGPPPSGERPNTTRQSPVARVTDARIESVESLRYDAPLRTASRTQFPSIASIFRERGRSNAATN
jgi:hypothetical protein